ncbi:hypothetical protein MRB53_023166 [Persea americana]|uniref:Uncharacterized protein n=1 Tax=Persea americana TaxID=3435 RepID=A0ACC2L961_PERAE|nr:hypothetical protein MRB53_023166 [Persea americana]
MFLIKDQVLLYDAEIAQAVPGRRRKRQSIPRLCVFVEERSRSARALADDGRRSRGSALKSKRIRNLSGRRSDPDLQIVAAAGELVTAADFRLRLQRVCTLQKLDPEETEDPILWWAITLEKWRPVAKQRIPIYSQGGPSRADPGRSGGVEKEEATVLHVAETRTEEEEKHRQS